MRGLSVVAPQPRKRDDGRGGCMLEIMHACMRPAGVSRECDVFVRDGINIRHGILRRQLQRRGIRLYDDGDMQSGIL